VEDVFCKGFKGDKAPEEDRYPDEEDTGGDKEAFSLPVLAIKSYNIYVRNCTAR